MWLRRWISRWRCAASSPAWRTWQPTFSASTRNCFASCRHAAAFAGFGYGWCTGHTTGQRRICRMGRSQCAANSRRPRAGRWPPERHRRLGAGGRSTRRTAGEMAEDGGRQFVVRPFTPSMSFKTVTALSADWHEAVANNMDGPSSLSGTLVPGGEDRRLRNSPDRGQRRALPRRRGHAPLRRYVRR